MTLEQLIKLALDARLLDVHVAIPGKVESFNGETCKVSVRPMLKRQIPTVTGAIKVEELPVIQDVRICYPGGSGLAIAYPLDPGDTGVILFCEVPITQWARTGEISDPADSRRHSLAGAVFYPGLRTDGDTIAVSSDGITLGTADGSFSLKVKGDRVEIGGSSDAAALASKVSELAAAIDATITGFLPGAGGASFGVPFEPPASFSSSKLLLGG